MSDTKHDAFHIVTQVNDWQQHKNEQQQKQQALSYSANIATSRNLENAAENFRPAKGLLNAINAINAAIAARVPLLLTGEPGTGKTQVAWYLKCFFDIPLFSYQVHSNSEATALRYDFDAVAYLRDAYLAQQSPDQQEAQNGDDPRANPRYLKKAALWNAYQQQGESVLLIDEIDKAPRDFPNDLLQELDQYRFEHPFHKGEFIKGEGAPPLTIITSNGERRLPDAFLRRCMVYQITLDKGLLHSIMQAWGSQFPRLDEQVQQTALQHFMTIRDISRLSKHPGTAELLLWLSVLSAQNIKQSDLEVSLNKLPALECLIKDHDDYQYLK